MQSKDANTRTTGALTHPDAAEWMEFLYAETAPKRKRELAAHLAQCGDCTEYVASLRASMTSLDEWKLPAIRRTTRSSSLPAVKWAAVAAIVLVIGFVFGRQTAPGKAELAALKTSVARLAESIPQARGAGLSNSVNVATAAANAETLRLLSDFALLHESQRATDQQNLAVSLRSFETRLGRLRAELETVAMNTENGFEQTHENLTRLASFSAPVKNNN